MRRSFAIFCLLAGCTATAQYVETIGSDRPGQGNSAYSVGTGVIQAQGGFIYNNTVVGSENFDDNGFDFLIRGGITERIELNAGLFTWSETDEFIDAIRFGGRYHIEDNEGWFPALSLQYLVINYPIRTSNEFESLLTLATSNQLSDRWSLNSNLNLLMDGTSDFYYNVNFGYMISENIGAFVEYYGYLDRYRNDIGTHSNYYSRFDGGIAVLLGSDIQLDLFGGGGIHEHFEDYFISGGASWRTKLGEE